MRGLWNWFKKSRSFECGFSSGRLLAPYCLRRSFAISSERPCSELASLSYVFSNEYEYHVRAIVWIVSEFWLYFSPPLAIWSRHPSHQFAKSSLLESFLLHRVNSIPTLRIRSAAVLAGGGPPKRQPPRRAIRHPLRTLRPLPDSRRR